MAKVLTGSVAAVHNILEVPIEQEHFFVGFQTLFIQNLGRFLLLLIILVFAFFLLVFDRTSGQGCRIGSCLRLWRVCVVPIQIVFE